MKGNSNMSSEDLDIVAEDSAKFVAPTPAPAVMPAPAAKNEDDAKIVSVDVFGGKRHINIPNVK